MNADCALHGLSVLITRPKHQAETLLRLVESHGGRGVLFPTLEIRGLDAGALVFSNPGYLSQYDWLVFISANAVSFALKACDNALRVPGGAKIAAIGQATAAALEQHGIRVDLKPLDRCDSESLLALPQMHSVVGQSFLIVRGQGGRDFLADALRQRGAHVRYAEVYQRIRPTIDIAVHLRSWRERGIDAVTIFSGESLDNFVELLGDQGMPLVRNIPLLLVSERIQAQAQRHGFTRTWIADRATDQAMLEALAEIADLRQKNSKA